MSIEVMQHHGFDKPFDKNGKPKRFVALIIPLFTSETTTRLKMLNSADPTITERNFKDKRGTNSTTLSALVRSGILKANERVGGYSRGENWDLFLTNLTKEILKHEITRTRFMDIVVRYENNAVDFFMKTM
jgi:hypothetical protein